ncbi:hypothetical protein BDD12DRAFT_662111, partial [Trichophaea hybrida]
IGILTAIVAAIRVGGPPWLKAVVGRARENDAIVEMELMSSTSHEVCELWNGHGIVKSMGRPEVRQIIYIDNLKNDKETPGTDIARRSSTDSASKRVSDDDRSAPNISLNLHDGSKSGELYAAALCGIIIQFGMVVFCGFSVYHPEFSQRFPKNGRPVQGYAFPIMATGTVILMIGMLICSAVVEKSTVEKEYKLKPENQSEDSNATTTTIDAGAGVGGEPNVRLLWLQKSHTVSDQAFDSFVLFGPSSSRHNRILTWVKWHLKKIASNGTEMFTVLGVFLGLCGFILQFHGLRGMNWSASIAQLVCIFLMTIWRAWIRRGLIANPVPKRLRENHEMDWLA